LHKLIGFAKFVIEDEARNFSPPYQNYFDTSYELYITNTKGRTTTSESLFNEIKSETVTAIDKLLNFVSENKLDKYDITYQSISLILKRLEENFGMSTINNIILNGVPEDFESAEALANKNDDKTRKEFEKWAVLTYSNNRAIINEKKEATAELMG
jgi:hypothetical protein